MSTSTTAALLHLGFDLGHTNPSYLLLPSRLRKSSGTQVLGPLPHFSLGLTLGKFRKKVVAPAVLP